MSFILTNLGLEKQSAAIRDNLPFTFKKMVFGNGTRVPSGGETSLENQLLSKPLTSVEATEGVPGSSDFRSFIPSTDGPNAFSEVGLLDDDDDLVAIGRLDPSIVIADPGDRVDNYDVTVTLLHSNSNNLVIRVDNPTGFVPTGRRVDTGKGLDGGGDLAQDRTIELSLGSLDEITAEQTVMGDDGIPLQDHSSDEAKLLPLDEVADAIGVPDLIQTAIDNLPADQVLELAGEAETIAGVTSDTATHPAGVKAAILHHLGLAPTNVRSFEHANDANEPTSGEWNSPTDGAKALVSNASNDSWSLYQRRATAWVELSNSGSGSGSIVAFWAGYLDNGSAISSSGLSWNEYSLGQATFDLDAVQTDDWVIINYRPQANQVISVPAGETDFQVYTSTSDDQGLVLAIKA